mgnify:CR=1 FL=1
MSTVNMNHHTTNVISQIMESRTQGLEPKVGMPVTMNHYTDRTAATIIEVNPKKTKVIVVENKVQCIDYYAGKYEVLPELEGIPMAFTKRTNGRWVREGEPAGKGLGLTLGVHRHWVDPSF